MATVARLVLAAVIALLPCGSAAGADSPQGQPERCTVAVTAAVGGRLFYGTGSIISPLGYILTSTTVVPAGSTSITVLSPDRLIRKGTLIKADERLELAVIRIDPPADSSLPFFTIRNSRNARLGEVVMTVSNVFRPGWGNPELSVSVGLLSGRYSLIRQLASQPVYVGDVIETTAAANPGSDGGPLLDGSGQLIGVLSINISNARWLGVAVPTETTLPEVEQAIRADLAARHIKLAALPLRVVEESGVPLFPKWEARAVRFQRAARKVAPCVVAIQVDRIEDDARIIGPPLPFSVRGTLLEQMSKRPNASATGVIVGPDGWIATSYFNIAGKLRSVKVVLSDGRVFDANVIGWDEDRDLALLRIEAGRLPVVEFGHSLTTGTFVCALGRSPEPANLTLTPGIVSAVGRGEYSLLQFDARANVGNTGGPLVDLDGRCVGIIGGVTPRSPQGQNSGVAFAAGSDILPALLEELKTGKKIAHRPRTGLGVVLAPGAVDLPGVLVSQVLPNSAAAAAGILPRDSILRFDGVEVNGDAELINMIRAKKPGDKVKLTVRRQARQMEVEVTLSELNG